MLKKMCAALAALLAMTANAAAQAPAGVEFRVNTYTTSSQAWPAAATRGNGEFVAAWVSYAQAGLVEPMVGQLLDAAGAAVAAEFLVSTYTTANHATPSVAGDPKGNAMVVWHRKDGDADGVFGRRFDPTGAARGAEFRINTYTTSARRSARRSRQDPAGRSWWCGPATSRTAASTPASSDSASTPPARRWARSSRSIPIRPAARTRRS